MSTETHHPLPASSLPSSLPWPKRATIRGRSKEIVLCVRFSNDDNTVIVAHFDGQISGYDTQTLAVKFELSIQGAEDGRKTQRRLPVTSLSIRPTLAKPVAFIVTTTIGMIEKYDMKSLERQARWFEDDNEVYASDYASNGAFFATAGRDASVRVYDDSNNTVIRIFKHAPDFPTNAAALRLFSVRFDPQDPKIVYSGGWSNTIHSHSLDDKPSHDIYGDHRHEFFGAYLTGDALDIVHGRLVTASNRVTDVLQQWDLKTLKPTVIPWPLKDQFMPNCARLSPDGRYVAVGGGGGQGLKEGFFVMEIETAKVVVEALLEKSVTACTFANREALVAFGDADGIVHLYENRFASKK